MSTAGGIVTVIGATGFVGRHVVARLVDCGYTVRAMLKDMPPEEAEKYRPMFRD